MADNIETPQTEGAEPTLELTPEEQQALDKVRGNKPDYVEENFNPDGTPKDTFEIPEKFKGKTAEEIAKAYVELEKMKSKETQEQPTKDPETIKNDPQEQPKEETEAEKEVNKLLEPKDFKKYEESYLQNGELTEADYKELADRGLSKEIVDTYIEAQKIRGEVYTKTIYETAGGEEAYNQMIEWARENFTEAQAKRFDSDITSGNLEYAKEAIETLKLRMGNPPRRIEGQSIGDGGLKPFSNRQEYFNAVRNPAYKTDRKYAELVDNRYLAGRQKGLY